MDLYRTFYILRQSTFDDVPGEVQAIPEKRLVYAQESWILEPKKTRERYKDFMSWLCPRCDRTFRQVNQRHSCGVGSADTLLKNRSPALIDLYRKLETTVRGFGDVEVVTRDRYVLFRTTRIFADLTVMRDALRVVVHIGRKVSAPYFIKIGPSGNRVSHVTLVRTAEDLGTIIPFLREAFDLAMKEES